MIYVIQSNGKGDGNADSVTFRVFESTQDACNYVDIHEKKYSNGHKHWVRFDIVEPGDVVENFSE